MSKTLNKKQIIVIVGPTASGKSALAVRLAKKFDGEIISADSRQVYRGLDIGTAKITKKEMRGVKHYCLDIANPKKPFTADDFRKAADKAIMKICVKGKIPIMVGGAGFYIDITMHRSDLPNAAPDWKLRKMLEKKSAETLFAILKKLDPRRTKNIDPYNKRRIIRAIEIIKITDKMIAEISKAPRYNAKIIGIKMPKEELRKRIVKRTEAMLKRGLFDEVKKLKRTLSKKRLMELGFEYKYPLLCLEGKISRREMIQKINTETWRYAKRQMSYFRKMENICWTSDARGIEKLVKNALTSNETQIIKQ